MPKEPKSITILLADDSEDDRILTREALQENYLSNDVREVEDGEELMDYLLQNGAYADPASSPLPGLILLDLNMPKKNGHEALGEIKAHPVLKRIPVVVFSTSAAEEDVLRSYDLGVNSYITKPVTFDGMVNVMKTLADYWIQIVAAPPMGPDFDRRRRRFE
jgi:CheY-like chemotaxis protein